MIREAEVRVREHAVGLKKLGRVARVCLGRCLKFRLLQHAEVFVPNGLPWLQAMKEATVIGPVPST